MSDSEKEHIADVLRLERRGNHPLFGAERGFAPEVSDIMLPESVYKLLLKLYR